MIGQVCNETVLLSPSPNETSSTYHCKVQVGTQSVCNVLPRCGVIQVQPWRGSPLKHFSFQPVLYNWCNKDHCRHHSVCGVVHIKYPLLLIEKGSSSDQKGELMLWQQQVSCLTCYVVVMPGGDYQKFVIITLVINFTKKALTTEVRLPEFSNAAI